MNFISHGKGEIYEALRNGEEVYILETDNNGNDDVLIGTHEECLRDVLAFEEIEELPENWILEKMEYTAEEFKNLFEETE